MKGTYKNSKEVLSPPSDNIQNTIVNKGQIKNGLCSKKNYFKKNTEEDYVFLSGTVRPPFEREFRLDGVT